MNDLGHLSKRVAALLIKKKCTISTAESCTGGLIAKLLTDVNGVSKVYMGGVVCYSNEVKERLLKVRAATLKQYGAVSSECAREMAQGSQRLFTTKLAVSVTGIAGPSGGSVQKPVGLVYMHICLGRKQVALQSYFKGTRGQVRELAAFTVLKQIENLLLNS